MWAQLASAALGIWLMAAPAVLDSGAAASVNDRIVGPIVATLGIVAAWEVMRGLRWGNVALGAWLLVAPWILGYAQAPLVNSLVAGILIIALSSIRGRIEGRYGGGWAALVRSSKNPG